MSVLTRFVERILLESGTELEADVIVTATGLNMVPFGRIDLHVDEEKVDLNDRLLHKAAMVSGVPNFAFVVGYTNQAWTLKSDLVSDYVCRLLAHMDRHGPGTRHVARHQGRLAERTGRRGRAAPAPHPDRLGPP